jgi:hypothetical protein
VAFIKWRDVVKQLGDPGFWSGYDGDVTTDQISELMIDSYTLNEYKKLFDTMQYFFVQGRKLGLDWDLHTENCMQRGDGTLVITDPFFTG